MSNHINFLITLSNGSYLIRVSLRAISSQFSDFESVIKGYYLEPDVKEQFKKLLPAHVLSFGEIVEIQEIFDSVDETDR